MTKRVTHNLRFSAGDLLIIKDRKAIGGETWASGPRIVGMSNAPVHSLIPGSMHMAISDSIQSNHRTNKKLWLEIMLNGRIIPVWSSFFNMKKADHDENK
jgi:hypothetical protein